MVIQNNDPGCRPMHVINLAGFLARSEVNGPGTRAVVWVQGCPFRCEGCFNASFQPFSPATPVPVGTLAGRILSLEGIDGVTFSGGEPFAHAGPLAALGERLRAAGLSVVIYTGYTAEEIFSGDDPAWPPLLAVTDLLIAGPYIAAQAWADPLTGSANQRVISLGMRIRQQVNPAGAGPAGSSAEFTLAPDGTITTTGFPAPCLLRDLGTRCRGS